MMDHRLGSIGLTSRSSMVGVEATTPGRTAAAATAIAAKGFVRRTPLAKVENEARGRAQGCGLWVVKPSTSHATVVDDEIFVGPVGSAEKAAAARVAASLGPGGVTPGPQGFAVYVDNCGSCSSCDEVDEADRESSGSPLVPSRLEFVDVDADVGDDADVEVSQMEHVRGPVQEPVQIVRTWFPRSVQVAGAVGALGVNCHLRVHLGQWACHETETRGGVVINVQGPHSLGLKTADLAPLRDTVMVRSGMVAAAAAKAAKAAARAGAAAAAKAAATAKAKAAAAAAAAAAAEAAAQSRAAATIQAVWRGRQTRAVIYAWIAAVPKMQARVRGVLARSAAAKRMAAVVTLQAWARALVVRREINRWHTAATLIQRWYRKHRSIIKYKEQVMANMSIKYAIGTAMCGARRRKQDSQMAKIRSMIKGTKRSPVKGAVPARAPAAVRALDLAPAPAQDPAPVRAQDRAQAPALAPALTTSTMSSLSSSSSSSSSRKSKDILSALKEKKRRLEAIRAERARLQSDLAGSSASASAPVSAPALSRETETATVPVAVSSPVRETALRNMPPSAVVSPIAMRTESVTTELTELERELLDKVSETTGVRQHEGSASFAVLDDSNDGFDFDEFSDDEFGDYERGNVSMTGVVDAWDERSRDELERLVGRNTTINAISRVRVLQRKPKMSSAAILAARSAKAAGQKTQRVTWASILAHETSLCSTPTPKISTPVSRLKSTPTQFPHKDSAPSPVYIQRFA